MGISNIDVDLIKLSKVFESYFPKERLRLVVYYPLDKNMDRDNNTRE